MPAYKIAEPQPSNSRNELLMSQVEKVTLPDIGDFSDVEIIEIHVSVGDQIAVEESILTLESDKATMDVPSPFAGKITDLSISLGDKISEGDYLISVETQIESTLEVKSEDSIQPSPEPAHTVEPKHQTSDSDSQHRETKLEKVLLPDIGDFSEVEIIEINVSVGDSLSVEDPMLTLESDKATMDVPSPVKGVVTELVVKVGDKVSQDDHLLTINVSGISVDARHEELTSQIESTGKVSTEENGEAIEFSTPLTTDANLPKPPPSLPPPVERAKGMTPHASPSVRRFARELGADLSQIRGTGAKGRIIKEDVVKYIKGVLEDIPAHQAVQSFGPPPIPEVDFSKFGEFETVKLNKIKKITGDRLHRSWLDIPHVTHHDEADITELDLFRKEIDAEQRVSGNRVTILSFICKAIVNALQQFPTFNSSLSADTQSLIVKKYINIGVAVDTPNGLVVPVVKNIHNLGVLEIAKTLQQLSASAREGKLTPSDYQGGCFTISSLGGIGGRFFTPIINPPEVAILGVSRHKIQPFQGSNGEIVWKTMLPLSLSYDHRVIDGAEAARFTKFVCELLYDSRRILL